VVTSSALLDECLDAVTKDQIQTYLLRSPSSENGLDTLLTLDLPRSTFQDPGDGIGGLDDLFPVPSDLFRLREVREEGLLDS
jgi:hypothetical protein